MHKKTLTILVSMALASCVSGAEAQTRQSSGPPPPGMLDRPALLGFEEPRIERGGELLAYRLAWGESDAERVTDRLAGALEVVLGKQDAAELLPAKAAREALYPAVTGEEAGSWVRLEAAPLLVKYEAEHDEIRVLHEERDAIDETGRDVGVDGARQVAERALEQLAERGVIDGRLYAAAALQIGYRKLGSGPVGAEVEPGRIVGYRLTYRPRLAGFQLANAGLRLDVLPSGEIAGLRVGGVSPRGEWRDGRLVPTGEGGARKVEVEPQELMKQFYRRTDGVRPQIAWSRIMYVVPDGKREAVVAPMLVVSYTEHHQQGDRVVASRRKTLAYSLIDAQAPPLDFDPPATRHDGQQVTRER